MIFASALMFFVPMLWLVIYWSFGIRVPTTVPLIYQGLSAVALIFYYKTKNFRLLAHIQLGLFLVTPFAMQLVIAISLAVVDYALGLTSTDRCNRISWPA